MKENILLSICIPTYNRAEYLDSTIQSIVCQTIFIETNIVEIVISDNCSTDNTYEVSQKYVKLYKNKIKYFRNNNNIKDRNFEKALSHGSGLYLKLNNDTLLHKNNTLDVITNAIEDNYEKQYLLFFSNENKKGETVNIFGLDSFVKEASFASTWIGSFGIWKSDFIKFKDFNLRYEQQLVQTDVLFRLISSKKNIVIINSKIYESISPLQKGGYNIYQVFVSNYLELLRYYKKAGFVSNITFKNEKLKLLWHFLIPWTLKTFSNRNKYKFDTQNAFKIVLKEYHSNPLFYLGILYVLLLIIPLKIRLCIKKFTLK